MQDLQLNDLTNSQSDRKTIIEQLIAQAIRFDYSDNSKKTNFSKLRFICVVGCYKLKSY